MNRVAAVIAILSVFLIARAVDGHDPVFSPRPENPLEGALVFDQKGCGKCHAIWGSGGTLGPDLATVDQGWSVVEFAGVLWNHSPKMMEAMEEMKISRPKLTPEEMTALTAYLFYLNFFDKPGDAARGGGLISNKGGIKWPFGGGGGWGGGEARSGRPSISTATISRRSSLPQRCGTTAPRWPRRCANARWPGLN